MWTVPSADGCTERMRDEPRSARDAALQPLPTPGSTPGAMRAPKKPTASNATAPAGRIIAAGIVPVAMEYMDRLAIAITEDFAKAGYPRDVEAMLIVEVEGSGLLDVDIHTIPASPKGPAHEHFDVRFLFRAPSDEASAGDDALATRWVLLDDPSFDDSDASVRTAVAREASSLLYFTSANTPT